VLRAAFSPPPPPPSPLHSRGQGNACDLALHYATSSRVDFRRLSRSDLLSLGRWNAHFRYVVTNERRHSSRRGEIQLILGAAAALRRRPTRNTRSPRSIRDRSRASWRAWIEWLLNAQLSVGPSYMSNPARNRSGWDYTSTGMTTRRVAASCSHVRARSSRESDRLTKSG